MATGEVTAHVLALRDVAKMHRELADRYDKAADVILGPEANGSEPKAKTISSETVERVLATMPLTGTVTISTLMSKAKLSRTAVSAAMDMLVHQGKIEYMGTAPNGAKKYKRS